MKTIQVDMFAVGNGAAVLIQFALEDGSLVTVLADGGMGYKHRADGVRKSLADAFNGFRAGRLRRIDLLIGTHYDGDHLKGLVPIVQDESIEIGEVWLPPLKNDTEEILGATDADDFLAEQLFDDQSHAVLLRYLVDKGRQVDELQRLEQRAVESAREMPRGEMESGPVALPGYSDERRNSEHLALARHAISVDAPLHERVEAFLAFFEAHEADAATRTGRQRAHESATYDSRYPDAVDLARQYRQRFRYASRPFDIESYRDQPDRLRIAPAALASIRQSIAAGAITVSHLSKLVDALRNRTPPIRPRCIFVTTGHPRRFVWAPGRRRFIGRNRGGESDVTLTVLGPSEQLIEKHREKLPVGAYLLALMHQDEPIHQENISASNQLSYIFTMEMAGQRLLISGDAGCYGFKDDGQQYYSDLLKPLAPLHVVQVAHHAGHNYDFYEALLTAGFAQQETPAFLLLSHATLDDKRPSRAFAKFVAGLRRERDSISLLFTGMPDLDKVEDYVELIHAVVPDGSDAEEGDIRMAYEADAHPNWTVERHAVVVGRR